MSRKNRLFAKLANTINDNGKLQETSLAADIDVGGVEGYADTNSLPANPSLGDLAFVTGTNILYVYSGSAWFNIALANQAPTAISGNEASYTLATDGTPTVVTLTSTDPEGFPLTWSATTSGDTQVGTVTNVDNVFTITPSTDNGDAGTLSVTFSVTDGNNSESSISSFSLSFLSRNWADVQISLKAYDTAGLTNENHTNEGDGPSFNRTNWYYATQTPMNSESPYNENWSVEFDGTDDAFTIPASSDFQFSTGDFTFEAFIKTDLSDYFSIWQNTPIQATASAHQYYFGVNNLGNLGIHRHAGGGGIGASGAEVKANTWTHVAAVRDSGTIRLYVDGTKVAEGTTGFSGLDIQTLDTHTIGYRVTPNYGKGFLSNLRIIKGAAIYSGETIQVPVQKLTAIAGTVILTMQDRAFGDNSSSNHTLTRVSEPKISPDNPLGNDFLDKDGLYGSFGILNYPSYWTGDVKNPGMRFSGVTFPTGQNWYMDFWMYRTSEGGKFMYYGQDAGAVNWSGTGITTNVGRRDRWGYTWGNECPRYSWHHHHVQHVWNSASNSHDTYYYVDGVRVSTGSHNFSPSSTDSESTVGMMFNKALIADMTIETGVWLYNGAATCPVPTAPKNDTDKYIYLSGGKRNGVYDAASKTRTMLGSAVSSSAELKYDTSNVHFSSRSSHWTAMDVAVGAANFTIEGWFYFTDTSQGNVYIAGQSGDYTTWEWGSASTTGTLPNTRFAVGRKSNGIAFWYDNLSAQQDDGTVPINTNTWYHLAWVRDGNNFRAYVDGVKRLDFEASSGGTPYNYIKQNFSVGYGDKGNTDQGFAGYMEDFQFLVGNAKYNADFTPPSAVQGMAYQLTS